MIRLDLLLVKKGLVNSREKAKALIKSNKVTVNGLTESKPSKKVNEESIIKLLEILICKKSRLQVIRSH